jgi:nucleotide-binding universal stress UspA family protein
MYKRVLVPVDGSEIADRALDEAIKLTKGYPVELKIVFIGRDDEISQQVIDVAMTKAGNAGLRPVSGLLGKLETEEIADVILQEATEWTADLIVMGTHGRRGVAHMFLGSVAEGVIRASPVPVLVIRGT